MGNTALADPAGIADWRYWDDKANWPYREGYIHYDADYRLIVDNLLDFSHLGYVHEASIGSSAAKELPAKISKSEAGLAFEKYWLDDDPAPHHAKYGGMTGKVDRWTLSDWHLRGNMLLMKAGATAAGNVTWEDGVPEPLEVPAIQFRHTSILTPETRTSTHYFYCQARDFGVDDPDLTGAIHNMAVAAFEEDRAIIEAQQKVIDVTPPDRPMGAIPHDKALQTMRRMIERAIAEEERLESIPAE